MNLLLIFRLEEVSAQLVVRDREKTATTEDLQKSQRALIEGEAEKKVLEQRIELLRDSLSEAQNERNHLQDQTNRLTKSLQVNSSIISEYEMTALFRKYLIKKCFLNLQVPYLRKYKRKKKSLLEQFQT